ncbi:hypothetical protein BB561_001604 [Smittium simulii]|uniref:hydroxymethylglutaryl-CoA lyase n=1 Tax=Smittium simulii TaxID=133385 RepID=A0A2T9YTV9_9FUNG|nr:hypothetical protein BB561_001604 [Smittium simulii]
MNLKLLSAKKSFFCRELSKTPLSLRKFRSFSTDPETLGFVKIVEVGPRDGLQNEKTLLDAEVKVELINRLSDSGLGVIEAASFVSPKWVPQMASSAQVYTNIKKKHNINYPVLVPNEKGLEAAINCGVKEIAVFAAASESFSNKNLNCSISKSFENFSLVTMKALKLGITVRGYVSCVLGCPYEGYVDPSVVADVCLKLQDLGCYEISLGDTIGVGTPEKSRHLIRTVSKKVPITNLAVHFHDTYGQAIANIYAALMEGIRTVDSSVAGLGGCPYAKGASGNVATEDVVYLLNGLGFQSGVDLVEIAKTGSWISKILSKPYSSKAGQATISKIHQ